MDTKNKRPAAIRVCSISDVECSHGCRMGACKKETVAADAAAQPDERAASKDVVTREQVEAWAKLAGIGAQTERWLERLADFAVFARAAAPQAALTTEQREAIEWAAGRAHVMSLGKPVDGNEFRRWRVLSNLFSNAPAAAATPPTERMSDAARDVLAERARQVNVEGWTPEHDDKYQFGEMASAAGCYAMFTEAYPPGDPAPNWPWDKGWWKPTTQRRNRVKAASLLLAEIERIDRAARKAEIERTQCKRGVGCAGLGECFAAHHGGSTKCGRDAEIERSDSAGGEAC